jgi:hypothetical protein
MYILHNISSVLWYLPPIVILKYITVLDFPRTKSIKVQQTYYYIYVNLDVCILLRVWDHGKGFPSTQPIFVVFTIILYLLHVSVLRPSSSRNMYYILLLH